MKPANLFFRLWGIRHIRAAYHLWRMEKHYAFYRSIGQLPVHMQSDLDLIEQIRKGAV